MYDDLQYKIKNDKSINLDAKGRSFPGDSSQKQFAIKSSEPSTEKFKLPALRDRFFIDISQLEPEDVLYSILQKKKRNSCEMPENTDLFLSRYEF